MDGAVEDGMMIQNEKLGSRSQHLLNRGASEAL